MCPEFFPTLIQAPHAHREKASPSLPYFACVARPVGRREIEGSQKAQEAMRLEWSNLEANEVFDMSTVQSWHVVRDRPVIGEKPSIMVPWRRS